MSDRIAYRGLDGQSVWCNGSVGFGHLMLRTTPESLHERLPRVLDGLLTITADARIDNRDELIAALGITSPKDVADSDLIVLAYQRWGTRCPEHLIGDFAFAIWDEQERRLFCARDHMGVKPFFYYLSDSTFAFASEIKALLTLDEVPRRVNEVEVADYLVDWLHDTKLTFFDEIFRLCPGHCMEIGPNHVAMTQYWHLDPSFTLELDSDEEYARRFRDLFTEAVRCRLRSAFPIASELSGGLDSSAVTCVCRELAVLNLKGPLDTFSVVFGEDPVSDEREFIAAINAQGNIRSHEISGYDLIDADDVAHILSHADEPIVYQNYLMQWATCRAAAQMGVRTLLDGLDGDMTVWHGGYRLSELLGAGRPMTMLREARMFAQRMESPLRGIVYTRAVEPLLPMALRKAIAWTLGDRAPWYGNLGIDLDFANRLGEKRRVKALESQYLKAERSVRTQHFRELNALGSSYSFELRDLIAAAFGVEMRHPFSDKRLVEFCLALPATQIFQAGFTRMIMRRALKDVLPPAVLCRQKKASLSPKFLSKLHALVSKDLSDMLSSERRKNDYLDVDLLRSKHLKNLAKPDPQDALVPWSTFVTLQWLARFDATVK